MEKLETDSNQFIKFLNGEDEKFVKTYEGSTGKKSKILISDTEILSSNPLNFLFLTHRIEIQTDIEFVNVVFPKRVTFNELIIHGNIIFRRCHIPSIVFNVDLKKGLFFSGCNIETLSFQRGNYEKIEVYGGKINNINFSVCPVFKSFKISGSENKSPLNSIDIYGSSDENPALGNIHISNKIINSLKIHQRINHPIHISDCYINSILLEKADFTLPLYLSNIQPDNSTSKKSFAIAESNLGTSQFSKIAFSKYAVSIKDSVILNAAFLNTDWPPKLAVDKQKTKSEKRNHYRDQSEMYRQLRLSMEKLGDKVQALKFYALEMQYVQKITPWNKRQFWNKLILWISWKITNYGQGFGRMLLVLFLSNALFFSLLIRCIQYKEIQLVSLAEHDWSMFWYGLGEYLKFINPIRELDESMYSGWIFIDGLARIISSYLIFSLIRSSRRFVK